MPETPKPPTLPQSPPDSLTPVDSSVVLDAETEFLNVYRDRHREQGRYPDASHCNGDTIGLTFSGGGIRSATFHLGVLQSLATAKLLARVDYVSGVSGGGCIASWLSAWILRAKGIGNVEAALSASSAPRATFPEEEPQAIWHLRRFTNPLTPRLGFLAEDPWTLIA